MGRPLRKIRNRELSRRAQYRVSDAHDDAVGEHHNERECGGQQAKPRPGGKQASPQKWEENQAHQNPSDQTEDQSFHGAVPAGKQPVSPTKQKSENQGAVREGQKPWHCRANGAADQIPEQPLQVVIGLKRRKETRPGLQKS